MCESVLRSPKLQGPESGADVIERIPRERIRREGICYASGRWLQILKGTGKVA